MSYCSTSVMMQLLRGALALASIVGGVMLTPRFWPAIGLFALAFYLMRGCPACWLAGLIDAMQRRDEHHQLPHGPAHHR